MRIKNDLTGSEVVGWFHAEPSTEAYNALGYLGLQQERGVFVAREGDQGLAWLIDDRGWNENWPVDARFTKGGPVFTNRDYDNDVWRGRAWSYPDCQQDTVDLPWEYDYDSALGAGGLQFYLVAEGLHRAGQQRNQNPLAYAPPDHKVRLVEVMYFPGPPPEGAEKLYFAE